MNITLLLTESELKTLISISDNIDFNKPFTSSIYNAQELILKPLLGEDLFNELILQVQNDNLNPANITLIEKFKSSLAYSTMYIALPNVWVKVRDTGLNFNTGSNFQNSDYKTLELMLNHYKQLRDSFLLDFKNWLIKNKNDYPLLKEQTITGSKTVKNTMFASIGKSYS